MLAKRMHKICLCYAFQEMRSKWGINMDEKSPNEMTQHQSAARKHGIYAFRDRGPDALIEPQQVSSLAELRELVRTQPGRDALRQEMTARVALICYMGFSELKNWADDGKPIWESPMIRRAATWMAELRRLLDTFPPEKEAIDITEILRGSEDDED